MWHAQGTIASRSTRLSGAMTNVRLSGQQMNRIRYSTEKITTANVSKLDDETGKREHVRMQPRRDHSSFCAEACDAMQVVARSMMRCWRRREIIDAYPNHMPWSSGPFKAGSVSSTKHTVEKTMTRKMKPPMMVLSSTYCHICSRREISRPRGDCAAPRAAFRPRTAAPERCCYSTWPRPCRSSLLLLERKPLLTTEGACRFRKYK